MNKILLAALATVLSSSHLFAQYSNHRVTAFVAGSFLTGSRTFDLGGPGLRETDHTKGPRLGFRFGMDLSERWGGEATYSFSRHDFVVRQAGPGNSVQEREFPDSVHHLLLNGSYYIVPGDVDTRPFVTFGIGIVHFGPTETAKARADQNFIDGSTRISSDTKFGINFGGGLERRISDRLGVRVDLRDHITSLPKFGLPEAPLNPGGVYYPVKGAVHDVELALGVVFYFQ